MTTQRPLVHQLYHPDGTRCAGVNCAWKEQRDHETFENHGGLEHSHRFQGQHLQHQHAGGDLVHGYFGHPEDPAPATPVAAYPVESQHTKGDGGWDYTHTTIDGITVTVYQAYGGDDFKLKDYVVVDVDTAANPGRVVKVTVNDGTVFHSATDTEVSAPCGQTFATRSEAEAHRVTCGECAGIEDDLRFIRKNNDDEE